MQVKQLFPTIAEPITQRLLPQEHLISFLQSDKAALIRFLISFSLSAGFSSKYILMNRSIEIGVKLIILILTFNA